MNGLFFRGNGERLGLDPVVQPSTDWKVSPVSGEISPLWEDAAGDPVEDLFEEDLHLAAIDLIQWMVILNDGRCLPIVSGWDSHDEEVEDLSDATLILFGSTEAGYYEIEMAGMVDPTFH